MINELTKYPLEDNLDISMPKQIKSLYDAGVNINVIDYDYIGTATEESLSAFAITFYNYLHEQYSEGRNPVLVTVSTPMKDSKLLKKAFHFNFYPSALNFKCDTYRYPIENETVSFIGIISMKEEACFKDVMKYLFTGIYESNDIIILSKLREDEILNLVKSTLRAEYDRYGYIRDCALSLSELSEIKGDIKILYPYGGTDFGSFIMFEF